MRLRARILSYLGPLFAAYAIYSFMDEPLFEFIFYFLLALPLVSLLLLLIMRKGLRWELVPLREEGRRLDEAHYLLKIENRLPILLPAIRFQLTGERDALGLYLLKAEPLKRSKLGKLPALEELAKEFRRKLPPAPAADLATYHEREAWMRQGGPKDAPWPEGREDDPARPRHGRLQLSLGAREEAVYRLSFIPAHCGVERLTAQEVSLEDLLGFFTMKSPLSQQSCEDFMVLPNPSFFRARVREDLPDPQPVDVERWTDRIGTEVNSLANIRAWRPGDRMKDIHWKVSAKAQEFYVKEFEDPRKGSILFLLDPYWKAGMPESMHQSFKDEMCEVTMALFQAMNRKEGPFTFRHLDQRIDVPGEGQNPRIVERYLAGLRFRDHQAESTAHGAGSRYFEQLTERSSRQGPAGLPSISKMLADEYKAESWRAIIIVTSWLGRPLVEEILRILRERSAQIILVSAEPSDYLAARFSLEQASEGPSEQLMRHAEFAMNEAQKLEELSLDELFSKNEGKRAHPLALREESLRRFRASGGLVFRAPFHSLLGMGYDEGIPTASSNSRRSSAPGARVKTQNEAQKGGDHA